MRGSGSGKRSRGCPICTLRFDATISTAYKAGQALHPARDLVRNSSPAQQFSQNPFPPNLHLCASLEQTLFLFHRARRIFFLVFQKENGGCIPAGEACIPAAVRRIPCGAQSLRKQKRWGFNSAWYHHAPPCGNAALLCEARNIQGTSARQSRVAQRFIWQKHHFFVDKIRNVYYAEKEAAGRIPASS